MPKAMSCASATHYLRRVSPLLPARIHSTGLRTARTQSYLLPCTVLQTAPAKLCALWSRLRLGNRRRIRCTHTGHRSPVELCQHPICNALCSPDAQQRSQRTTSRSMSLCWIEQICSLLLTKTTCCLAKSLCVCLSEPWISVLEVA